jgi:ATP-binding cassette subfamily D (ALD) protein 2
MAIFSKLSSTFSDLLSGNNKNRVKLAVLFSAAAIAAVHQYNKHKSNNSNAVTNLKSRQSKAGKLSASSKKVAVNKEFLNRLKELIPIILPGPKSKEFFLLVLHTCFLVSRTLLSIYVARLDGSIVKSIVDRKLEEFIWLMAKWMLVAVPATYVNSMISYLESKLSIAFRTRLVNYCYELYMSNDTYYRIGNLDSRLINPDQCLTEDVSVFCSDLAHLYSHLSKPCLDIVLMTAQLIMLARARGGGTQTSLLPSLIATFVILGTGYVLKFATPPFGKLVAEQAKLYGELRAAHSRVITHSEEIAFYSGEKLEEKVLKNTYSDLIKHTNYIYRKRIFFTMLEQFLMRYVWGKIHSAKLHSGFALQSFKINRFH